MPSVRSYSALRLQREAAYSGGICRAVGPTLIAVLCVHVWTSGRATVTDSAERFQILRLLVFIRWTVIAILLR